MNPQQLASILVRVLGLSLCASSVPSILSGVLSLAQYHDAHVQGYNPYSYYLLSSICLCLIGLWMLIKSRWIVEKIIIQ